MSCSVFLSCEWNSVFEIVILVLYDIIHAGNTPPTHPHPSILILPKPPPTTYSYITYSLVTVWYIRVFLLFIHLNNYHNVFYDKTWSLLLHMHFICISSRHTYWLIPITHTHIRPSSPSASVFWCLISYHSLITIYSSAWIFQFSMFSFLLYLCNICMFSTLVLYRHVTVTIFLNFDAPLCSQYLICSKDIYIF